MESLARTGPARRRRKVCIIGDSATKRDAISAAIVADCNALQASGEFDPFFLSGMCQISIPHANIRGLRELLYHPRFVDADIRLFHFGFYSEVFNACLLGSQRAKRIVRYHNVAPLEIVDPSQRPRIEKAHRQLAVLANADEIWPISPYNGRTFAELGFAVDLAKTLSMPIEPLARRVDLRSKPGPITIAYIGRLVPAKGVQFLLDAFELLTARGHSDVELVCAGSPYVRGYADAVRARLGRGLLKNARYLGYLGDAKLAKVYAQASIVAIPSLHEGLCVPVIEALHAGAIPVVSNTTALPETLNGLGRLAPVRDPVALANCLEEVIADIRAIRRNPDNATIGIERGRLALDDYYAAVSRYVANYSSAVVGAELVRRLRVLTQVSASSST